MAHELAHPGDRLAGFDFDAHNTDVDQLWRDFNAGAPSRVPIIFGTNTRYFVFNEHANAAGIEFEQYSRDPDVMFDARLRFARWSRFNLLQDQPLGPPRAWRIEPDFQNYYEAAWLGCPIEYMNGQVPDTTPAFEDAPERIMERGLPDPFGGLGQTALQFLERFRERAKNETYLDRPIEVGVPMLWTDGVFTVACNVFGPTFVCTAMLDEPERLEKLLAFLTEATIRRMTAWREVAGIPVPQDDFWFADDSVALISTEAYVEHVLPHHRRLCDAMSKPAAPRSIHLCGDATRHFVTLRDELNIQSFDTGFPVDFAQLRQQLGPAVRIQGGPHVELMLRGTPGAIREEVRRILQSGVLRGRRFVLREGNNLGPHTPIDNCEAMYHAGREFGVFDD
jgi:uroporphyrinogen-III decarboxylase